MSILNEAEEFIEMKLAVRWINKILEALAGWEIVHDANRWYVNKR